MRKPKEPPRFAITVIFTIIVFCILMITMMVVGIAVYFLANAGIIVVPNLGALLLTIAVASIIVGTIISVFWAKYQ